MRLTRRTLVLAGIAAPLAAPFEARAQSWPSGPVRIVVAYPPGGSTDASRACINALVPLS
jgi:tripartite-type tricarboxylate transporter receptor subunit TctC